MGIANTRSMKNVKVMIAAVGCALTLAVAAGCARGGKTADGGGSATTKAPGGTAGDVNAPVKPELRYKVVADDTAFYRLSVQQPGGPDDHLKKDTRLTLVKRYGGFAQVQTRGGLTGYVPSSGIAPLSSKEVADEDAATLAAQAPPNALAPLTSGPGSTYSIPPEATRDTALPVSDPNGAPTPKPTPNSMFRY